MPVTFRDVTMRFPARTLFSGLDDEIAAGTMVALLGPSGAGKSTLLGIVAGLVQPTGGTVLVGPADATVDWVFQSAPVLGRRTATDNVALGAMAAGLEYPEAVARARQCLALVDLDGAGQLSAYRLSGGEKQRVSVARSLSREPDVLLADEPTASLDPESRSLVCAALRAAATAGTAVLVATHDPVVAAACDRSIVLPP